MRTLEYVSTFGLQLYKTLNCYREEDRIAPAQLTYFFLSEVCFSGWSAAAAKGEGAGKVQDQTSINRQDTATAWGSDRSEV